MGQHLMMGNTTIRTRIEYLQREDAQTNGDLQVSSNDGTESQGVIPQKGYASARILIFVPGEHQRVESTSMTKFHSENFEVIVVIFVMAAGFLGLGSKISLITKPMPPLELHDEEELEGGRV
ncbi:hypothetical protein RND71_036840 [Anisodus tanguticus]|uniref:Uncharacterized protein n=1 Tax=Anisodus tanguticus TaxID=243964 RepID=A0AAE1R2I2_9SOLA|nr:hypothetical protein RND71_036840 [Anisodus tanguticus]